MPKIYKINLDNENHINAIATHNQNIRIKYVEYDDGSTSEFRESLNEKCGKDLHSIVRYAKARNRDAKEIEVNYTTERSQTLFCVFPPIDPDIKEEYRKTSSQELVLGRFYSFINRLIYDMNIAEKPPLEPITKEEAVNIFRSFDSNILISGALHLPKRNTIIFENEGYCYYLVYGENPSFDLVKDISLDIEYGFDYKRVYADYDFASNLHDYFIAWKDNNYQGALFPSSAGINAIVTPVQSVQKSAMPKIESSSTLTTNSSYKEICQRLSSLTTPLICDAFPSVRLMDSEIAPVSENEHFVGRAYTVNSVQDSLSTMQALDDLQAFLAFLNVTNTDIVPTVLLIASCGAPYALAGGMCADVAKTKGFGAVITDGPCRDIKEIRECGIPFFAKGKCAKSGPKNKVGSIREKVQCGGVEVNPGDIVLADVDGIVVMSKEEAVSAVAKAEEIQMKEDIALQKIHEGARFNQICNINEHIENIRAGVPSKLKLTP